MTGLSFWLDVQFEAGIIEPGNDGRFFATIALVERQSRDSRNLRRLLSDVPVVELETVEEPAEFIRKSFTLNDFSPPATEAVRSLTDAAVAPPRLFAPIFMVEAAAA